MDNVRELIKNRFELAEKYLELSLQQESAIAADDDELLLKLLERRESLAREIDEANKPLEAKLAEYQKNGSIGSAEDDELLKKTRELFVKSLTLDRKNMAAIKDQMQKATGDSKDLKKRREGISKYAQADYIFTPSVLDERQ